MMPNKKMIGKSNIILFALPIILVHIWQLVEHAKSPLVAFIPMFFNCKNIKGLETGVIVRLLLIGSAPP